MGDVVDLGAAREEREPHMSGPMICVGCRYEWEGVVPVGVTEFECPSCGREKGVHKHFAFPGDLEIFICNHCDSTLFSILRGGGCMCSGCGYVHNPWSD